MKRSLLLLSFAALLLPALSQAEETRWDVLRVYRLREAQAWWSKSREEP